jgi:hypothetical protein
MFKKLKKFIAIFLILAVLFPSLAGPVRAFDSGPNSSYPFQFWRAVFDTQEMNLQSFVYETMRAVITSIITLIIGTPKNYEDADIYNQLKTIVEGQFSMDMVPTDGALVQIAAFSTALYQNPPASGVTYLADIGQRLNLVPATYAQGQGVGWGKMNDYLPVWKAFRNIAYALLVLVVVAMGFMIMFRVKTSPQTVITVQSALPRIILGLILITFSYAIVGFLIDIMYLAINLVIVLLQDLDVWSGQGANTLEQLDIILLEPPTTNDLAIIGNIFALGFIPLSLLLIVLIFVALLTIPTGIGVVGAVVLMLIVIVVGLIAFLKVCWTLLKAYVNVVLALIFGPIQLLLGVLPGSQAIGSWFRNILSNLAVFPVVATMVYLAAYLCLRAVSNILNGENLFANLLVLPIIAIGILLTTPKASDMIKAFMAKKQFPVGTAIGQAITPPGMRYIGPGLIQQTGEHAYRMGAPGVTSPPPAQARWRWVEKGAKLLGYKPQP